MGEEFPLDPNQVRPPEEQEGQLPQPQEGNPQVGDEVQPQSEQVEGGDQQAEHTDEPVHLATFDHSEDDANKLRPEEAIYSPDRVRNQDKAKVMAHAQDESFDKLTNASKPLGYSTAYYDKPRSRRIGEEAGRDYEVAEVAKKYNITPEQASEQIRADTTAFLEYGHAIVENHRKYNDTIGPSLEVVETAHNFVKQHPDALDEGVKYMRMTEDGKFVDSYVGVDISNDDGVLKIKITEKDKKRTQEMSTGVFEGVTYRITEHSRDGVGFSVETIRTKELDYDFDQERYLADFKEELSRIKDYVEPKRAPYVEEEWEDEDEDPLAGDVDKWVDPSETDDKGPYATQHEANVARQHGDYTG